MAKKKSPETLIPLVTSYNHYPVPLTDRFGEFTDAKQLERFWLKEVSPKHAGAIDAVRDAHRNLIQQYGQTDMPASIPGDPRLFQAEEMTFVAHGIDKIGRNKLGLHAELELFTDDDSDDTIAALVESWRERLVYLTNLYNHTTFFLAMGDMTYKSRLTVNAFTPLHNGTIKNIQLAPPSKQFMVSPYHTEALQPDLEFCPTLAEIAEVLIQMGPHDRSTQNAVSLARTHTRNRKLVA